MNSSEFEKRERKRRLKGEAEKRKRMKGNEERTSNLLLHSCIHIGSKFNGTFRPRSDWNWPLDSI